MQEVTSKGACYRCGKLGHYERKFVQTDKTRTEAPTDNGRYEKQAQRNNHNVRNAGNDYLKSYFLLMDKTVEEGALKEWILNSSATQHMMNDVEVLINIREANSVVEMVNENKVKIDNVGPLTASTVVEKEVKMSP